MVLYLYLFFLAFVVSLNLWLAVFIFYKNADSLKNRLYSYTILMLVIWGIGIFVEKISLSKDWAIVGIKIAALGYVFMPVFFLYFVFAFIGKKNVWKNWLLFLLLFAVPVFLLYLYWNSKFIIQDVVLTSNGFSAKLGLGVYFYFIYLFLYIGIALFYCFRFHIRTRYKREKKQSFLVCLGTLIPFVLGLVVELIFWYQNAQLPPISILFTIINTAFVSYGIVKYRFLSLPELISAELILSAIKDVVIVIDNNLNIRKINKSGLELLGYNVEELQGNNFLMILKGVDKNALFQDNINLDNSKVYLYDINKKKIPVHITKEVITDIAGDVMGVVLVARDIRDKELINTKKKLRESLKRKINELESFSNIV